MKRLMMIVAVVAMAAAFSGCCGMCPKRAGSKCDKKPALKCACPSKEACKCPSPAKPACKCPDKAKCKCPK